MHKTKKFQKINSGTFPICRFLDNFLVNLTTKQLETLFGALEDLDSKLGVLEQPAFRDPTAEELDLKD
jgi:hypothetical protein